MSPLSFECLVVIITTTLAFHVDGTTETTTSVMESESHSSDDAVSLISIMLSKFQCPFYSSCQKCITKETIKHILDGGRTQDSSIDYGTTAVFIASKVHEICSHTEGNGTSDTFCTNQSCIEEWADDHVTKEPLNLVDKIKVEALMRDIGRNYTPTTNICVTSHDILSEETSSTNNSRQISVSSVTAIIWSHLIRGHCLNLATDSVENIFELYETSKEENNTNKQLNREEIENLVTDVNHAISGCENTSKDIQYKPSHSHSHRKRRSEQASGILAKNQVSGCLNADSLFESTDQDTSQTLDIEEFKNRLCPAIIGQLTRRSTRSVNHETNKNTSTTNGMKSKPVMAYVYGTAAVTLISMCSLLGAIFIPNTKAPSNKQQYLLTGLIAMGFGILVGDALIHLVPQALGLHGDHSKEEVSSEHNEGNYLGKCIVMMAAIYFLFLFEGVCQAIFPNNSPNAHGHSHSMDLTEDRVPGMKSISQQTLTTSAYEVAVHETTIEEATVPLNQTPIVCCGLRNLALIVIVGDAIHNFADGLVIGAAFAASIPGGIASSFAILCHELPHELGDFAILLSTGLSRRRAIIVNLLSSLTCYIGFVIGVTIGSDESAIQWTMSITIGMFLFVALGDMMPELKSLRTLTPWTSLLIQNVAVLIGVGFTILMAIYEKDIQIIS